MEEERTEHGESGESISSSSSSCVSDGQEGLDDERILRLLDSLEHLISCRDLLAKSLSQGWMEIASARYSMGPSRISQALFSLRPHSASTLIAVSRTDNFVEDEGLTEDDEQVCHSQQEFQFTLQSLHRNDPSNNISRDQSANSEVSSWSHLRQRRMSGSAKRQHAYDDLLSNESDIVQDVDNNFNGSDSLAWFGTLVSPHLRAAQKSFREALTMIVEMAKAQITIQRTYQLMQERGE